MSEVVSIKTYDIDNKRMTVMIRQAKRKKDRMAPLSPVLLVMLSEYAIKYKPDKKGWLFGFDKRYAIQFPEFAGSYTKCQTKSLHYEAWQHKQPAAQFCYAFDRQGNRYFNDPKLLGHNDIKTTLRYLHTSNKDLLRIVSPLDELKLI